MKLTIQKSQNTFSFKRYLKKQERHLLNKPVFIDTMSLVKNKKGQGLIEYLILVALMGVATIGIVRTLNQTVKSRFANAIYALQGRPQKAKTLNVSKKDFERSDLSNFMNGASSSDAKRKRAR